MRRFTGPPCEGGGRAPLPLRVDLLGIWIGGRRPRNESAPLRPLTPYAKSKVRVEDDVAPIADSGFSPVFLRNATAFGFSPRLRADIVLNNLVGTAHA